MIHSNNTHPAVLSIARYLHAPLVDISAWEAHRYAWDGKTLAIGDLPDSNILHDLAHYAICWLRNPRRLKVPDFGLGPGNDSRPDSAVAPVLVQSNEEEYLASALGILWEKQLEERGLPFSWERTADDHNWNKTTFSSNRTGRETLNFYMSKARILADKRLLKLGVSHADALRVGLPILIDLPQSVI